MQAGNRYYIVSQPTGWGPSLMSDSAWKEEKSGRLHITPMSNLVEYLLDTPNIYLVNQSSWNNTRGFEHKQDMEGWGGGRAAKQNHYDNKGDAWRKKRRKKRIYILMSFRSIEPYICTAGTGNLMVQN